MAHVFIGSTSKDLKDYRQAAMDICLKYDLQPVAMEHFEAMGKGATEGSLIQLKRCDVYVGIFAYRYGYIEDTNDRRSVTEIEFDTAGEMEIERLCFLLDASHAWRPEYIEMNKATELKAFKDKVNATVIREEFTTVADFSAKLTHALISWKERNQVGRRGGLSAMLVENPNNMPDLPEIELVGRVELQADIHKAIDEGRQVLVHGFGGMGKTALAATIGAAFIVRTQGKVLWLKLGSSEPDALFEALTRPFRQQQATTSSSGEAKIQAMRGILSGLGEKVLLVLDDAWNGQALKTILKAVPKKMPVLVTARQRFALDKLFPVHRLETVEGLKMLGEHAGVDFDDNVEARDLCAFLGNYPFALKIAGATLKIDETSPAELQTRIKDAPHDMKTPDNFSEEGRESVKQLLDTSVDKLDDNTKAVFIGMGAFFAITITAEMLELYRGESVDKALTTLMRRGLLERIKDDDSVTHYRLHDLAYSYVRAQNDDAARDKALDKVLVYMKRYAEPSLENFASLRPELDNLMGAADFAMEQERYEDVERFISELYDNKFLDRQGYYTEAVQLSAHAIVATEKVGNIVNKGTHLGNLGSIYQILGEYNKAIEYHQQALAISREISDKRSESIWLGNLGSIYQILGEYNKAIEYHQRALAISQEIGNKRGQGEHLGNLGHIYGELKLSYSAIEYHEQSLGIKREIGDKRGEGTGIVNLGGVYLNLGETDKAIEYFEQALTIAREIGYKRAEGTCLGNLGLAYSDLGETDKAIEYHEQALTISREIGDRRREGLRIGNLGNAYLDLGETVKAIKYHEQALTISREIGDRRHEVIWLNNLGGTYKDLGDYSKAIAYYEQAKTIVDGLGLRHLIRSVDRNMVLAKRWQSWWWLAKVFRVFRRV